MALPPPNPTPMRTTQAHAIDAGAAVYAESSVMKAAAERPWVMRTYSGHTSAKASNALYRANLAKGQTGLSIAFDLPTQTGYDPGDPLALGETGKVGVPIAHLGDMDTLLDGIPLDTMNTSMTINATAMWLLALYTALAQRRGVPLETLQGTTQNDIVKEYLSRGTYIFPPGPSLRLTADMFAYCGRHIPKWNPANICSYHLQEAGATPVQEIAFALANAIAVLDAVRASGQIPAGEFPQIVGRLSFFVNAGLRFIEECCKLRAFCILWDEIARERYGVADANLRRFRYGVQVNSLGLTEPQPENNVPRIVLEMLAVVLSKNARARAIQLPAWNEALGLPRPWDQQWSLRIQQIMAYETDILEYGDIFDGSPVMAAKTQELMDGARAEMARIEAMGGAARAVESGYMKQELVRSQTARLRAIEAGELTVVGVNKYTETAPSPLTADAGNTVLRVDAGAEGEQIEALRAHRAARPAGEARAALENLADAAKSGVNLMDASIRCAHAGVTTGEWAGVLRRVFGEYRAATGIGAVSGVGGRVEAVAALRERARATAKILGRPIKMLVGKPGLDGHSNGAEQIAVKARDAGLEVVYEGIRLTPEQIAAAADQEGVHLIGISVLSGSHLELWGRLRAALAGRGLEEVPVVMGGIIPAADAAALRAQGVRAVYTPKDSDLNAILAGMIDIVRRENGLEPLGGVG